MNKLNNFISEVTARGGSVWFTSDTHYGHKNIVLSLTQWENKWGCRDFGTLEEHDNHIVDQINKHVMPDDVLFHLGDWSFGGIENIWNLRKRINCKNIYLCIGNHDYHIETNKSLPNCYCDENGEIYNGKLDNIFSSKYYYPSAGDLFKKFKHLYNIKVNGQRITICHYSMRTWYYHNKGSWMLFGHSHDTLHPHGKTIDVGLDSAKRILGEYRPFKFQELQNIMSKREVYHEDHHDSNTNAK